MLTNMERNQVNAAVFGDINQIAARERELLFGQTEEPVEIQIMRVQASEYAQETITEALQEADTIRDTAHAEGFQKGFDEGFAAGKVQAEIELQNDRVLVRSEFQAFINQIEAERRRVWSEAEPQIVAFVLEIAQKVVKDDAAVNRDIAISVIKNALRRVIDTETVRIRVNMEDLYTVRSSREELMELVDGIDHLEIIEDRRVAPGGCVVETSSGTIDARLETQFAEIQTMMANDMAPGPKAEEDDALSYNQGV